ncbi:MAG: hypothetical protein WBV93_16995, partial [Anaerobacillus sp.]
MVLLFSLYLDNMVEEWIGMVVLDGNRLTLNDLKKVLYDNEEVTCDPVSLQKVDESRKAVERIV